MKKYVHMGLYTIMIQLGIITSLNDILYLQVENEVHFPEIEISPNEVVFAAFFFF